MDLIGGRLARLEPGLAEVELPFRDDLTQQKGFVHGGIVGMIADSACGYAAFSLMPAGCSLVTVEYKINILAPALGDRLTARGEVVLAGDSCYFCRTLRERRRPRFVWDREQMLASLDRLEALEKGGARLFFGHDPDFWKDVPQAPVPAF